MIFNIFANSVKKEEIKFQKILDKCISETTHITGVAGTGKSNFLTVLTEKLYNDGKTYLMCSNSIRDFVSHFQKHKPGDNILFFILDRSKTHTIDINYLFSLDNFLNFACASEKDKADLKESIPQNWFSFLNHEENQRYFKKEYWKYINELIKDGYLDEHGDLNEESSKKQLSAYVALDYYPRITISEDEKDKYVFLLNIIQLSLSKERINVIFDEERIFFNGTQKNYIKDIHIEGVNNNYVFCSQLLNKVLDNVQTVCFRSFRFESASDVAIKDSFKHLGHILRELRPGEFLFFDKKGNISNQEPFVVTSFIGENKEIDWDVYLNNKQRKLCKKLNNELSINNTEKKKAIKI